MGCREIAGNADNETLRPLKSGWAVVATKPWSTRTTKLRAPLEPGWAEVATEPWSTPEEGPCPPGTKVG